MTDRPIISACDTVSHCYTTPSFHTTAQAAVSVSYQYLQQLLQVAGDQSMVFMKCPATLLRIVTVMCKVTEDHLQSLFIMAHLALWQRCTQILQRHEK